MLFRKNQLIETLTFGLTFIYFGIFRYFLIPSGDDYFWYGEKGSYLMSHGFFSTLPMVGGSSNGRYLGNLLEIAMMRHLAIGILVFAFFWTLLLWTIYQLTGRNLKMLPIALLLPFFMQNAFLNNILVWNNGFIIYVPSIALVLSYLVICRSNSQLQSSWLMSVLAFFIALAGGLFLENVTTLQIALALLLIIFFRKNLQKHHFAYLLGAIVSAAIMFSNRSYYVGPTAYRQTTHDPIKIWQTFVDYTHFWLISFNWIVIVVMAVSLIILAFKSTVSTLTKTIIIFSSATFGIYYSIISLVFSKFNQNEIYAFTNMNHTLATIDTLVSLLLIVFIAYCIYTFFKNDKFMWIYYLSAGISFGPMLIVISPVTSRGEFTSFIFIYLIVASFLIKAIQELQINPLSITVILSILLLFLAGNYQLKMYRNYQANLERVNQDSFLYDNKQLTKHVPYRKFVVVNDQLIQQDSTYWRLRLHK